MRAGPSLCDLNLSLTKTALRGNIYVLKVFMQIMAVNGKRANS
jgi:hypothetical protein